MTSKILVTGASGGFGMRTVLSLLQRGHAVAATMRDIAGRNATAAAQLRSRGATVVEMDVTQDASVEAAVGAALQALGGIDVVVNNAGVGVLGVQETFTPDDWKRLFEVNVFGVQRVNRAVLPHMRTRGSGLLLQISSLLGRIAIPFYGPYNASKWAVEAMAENYRVELSGFGVDVAIVEPGGFPTTFIDALLRPSDRSRDATLQGLPEFTGKFLHDFEQALAANPAQDPQLVADAVVQVIETPAGRRQFRTVVDRMGMGEAVEPYNEHLEKLGAGIYAAFGIAHLRQVKTG